MRRERLPSCTLIPASAFIGFSSSAAFSTASTDMRIVSPRPSCVLRFLLRHPLHITDSPVISSFVCWYLKE
jgi:hypothetical protein